MPRAVTVGLDGSAESRTAAEWAAREAESRGLPVRLIQVWEPVPEYAAVAPLVGTETYQHRTEQILREDAGDLRLRHPALEVTAEQLVGRPAEALVRAARDAELLVLGSRGLGGIGGFLVGSVGLEVVASTQRPVVLVRAAEQTPEERTTDRTGTPETAATPSGPVVLGLDTRHPHAAPIDFAFEAAAHRGVQLRALHGWHEPYHYLYGTAPDPKVTRMVAQSDAAALSEALQPWCQKYPDVEVVTRSSPGSPSVRLAEASHDASLVVVGRRVRRSTVGVHIGPVTHAVLHHSTAPVAVVAHD
ncbi:universal stress protein [Streptomyces sp. MS06]|uniref:universal stress protein n=1 Tax=Streptomyces sp. MS06 TaxID=3385974 RepID=UPI00399F4787